MSVLSTGLAKTSAGYDIPYSARFNDDDTAYLSRTFSAGNRKTWTWSGWVKRGNLNAWDALFSAGADIFIGGSDSIAFNNNALYIYTEGGSSGYAMIKTTQLFRDVSSWYHIVVAMDTTQVTASNRVKLYVNGEQITDFVTSQYPNLNVEGHTNYSYTHYVGRGYSKTADGYLAEVNFVDGQALTPSDFGETDEDYGHWKAKRYTGTYGTNGFYLDFKNSGSLGNDASSNSNNWTPNNLAATDQMLDSPTNNFCTLNPLDDTWSETTSGNLSEGNLDIDDAISGTWYSRAGTIAPSSGKWYFEVLVTSSNDFSQFGIHRTDVVTETGAGIARYRSNGKKVTTGYTTYGANWAGSGAVIGMRFDLDSGDVKFYKNNVSQGTFNISTVEGSYYPVLNISNEASMVANFGQDSSFAGNKTAQGNADDNGIGDFYYTPPTGYLALCTQNLPETTVVPSEHFNTVTWTGTGAGQAVTGVGFQPDLTWLKVRNGAGFHQLHDAVRGATSGALYSNATNAEDTPYGLTSFDSDGYTTHSANADWQSGSGYNFVAWNWKANGAGVTNNDGSIESTVSANVDAGFSIVSYTGTGTSGATVGHGLSSKPDMIIVKKRSGAEQWGVGTEERGYGTKLLFLESNSAEISNNSVLQNGTNATIFQIGADGITNASSATYIAYCFHSVEGYSKVGSYTGNGSADGPFVHCGFRPAYVMFKNTTAAAREWIIQDTVRQTYNAAPNNAYNLAANRSAIENDPTVLGGPANANNIDWLSNGFKIRFNNLNINESGGTYIFIAFAEHPFKYSTAK